MKFFGQGMLYDAHLIVRGGDATCQVFPFGRIPQE